MYFRRMCGWFYHRPKPEADKIFCSRFGVPNAGLAVSTPPVQVMQLTQSSKKKIGMAVKVMTAQGGHPIGITARRKQRNIPCRDL